MKKIIYSLVATAMIMFLTGCGSGKGVPYFTNIDSTSLAGSRGLFDARIMPKDEINHYSKHYGSRCSSTF